MRTLRLAIVGLMAVLLGCESRAPNGTPGAGFQGVASASVGRAKPTPSASSGAALLRAGPALPSELSDVLSECGERPVGRGYCTAFDRWSTSTLATGQNTERELIPLLADPRPIVRKLAADAISSHGCFLPDACAWAKDRALAEHVLDFAERDPDPLTLPDAAVNVISTRVVTGEGGFRCVDQWDRYLSNAEARIQTQQRPDGPLLESLFDLYDRAEATPKQKARVLSLARTVVAATNKDANMRILALRFIARHDPKALPYVQRFKADPASSLAKQAQKLEKQLKEADERARPTEPRRAQNPLR
jgi:hypothetical protein